jgi:hypothetical protein
MRRCLVSIIALILTGCSVFSPSNDDNEPLPTLVNPTIYPTDIFLTQNAPPDGFGLISWNPIDIDLSDHPGWVYTMSGEFSGVFDTSGEAATGNFTALVQSDELGESRRVVLTVQGLAISTHEAQVEVEGVRISNSYYVVNNNDICTSGGEEASAIADLAASQIIGGVIDAVSTGHQQDMQGVHVWNYTFSPENVLMPSLRRNGDSVVDISADLWAAPSINVVVRYELLLNVQHVQVLWGEQPVSGTLHLLYELSLPDLDQLPNISIPHGC